MALQLKSPWKPGDVGDVTEQQQQNFWESFRGTPIGSRVPVGATFTGPDPNVLHVHQGSAQAPTLTDV